MRPNLNKMDPALRKLHAEQPGSVMVEVLLRTADRATPTQIDHLREIGLDVQSVRVDILTAEATLADIARATTLPFVAQIDGAASLSLEDDASSSLSWLEGV